MDKPATVSARQAANQMGVSLYFVYQLLWTGKLFGQKVGNNWVIPASEVEARINARGR